MEKDYIQPVQTLSRAYLKSWILINHLTIDETDVQSLLTGILSRYEAFQVAMFTDFVPPQQWSPRNSYARRHDIN